MDFRILQRHYGASGCRDRTAFDGGRLSGLEAAMKGRVVLLDQIDGREAAALLVDGILEEIAIDPAGDALAPGAICRAIADRPVKGQGGLFVKLPGGVSGFLRQVSGIAPGQRLIVQVSGPAEPGKAVPVSARVLFKSRYAILTPGA